MFKENRNIMGKEDVSYLDTFLSAPTSTKISKHTICLAIPNRAWNHLRHDFWSSYEFCIQFYSEDSCAF